MSKRPEGSRPAGASLTIALTTAQEAIGALFANRVGWAAPLLLILLILAGILAVLSMVPAIAPFVYPVL